MSDKGYVYILTNPSFKENWVKIGMTKNTVEQRVSELDTTGVPLPFEIFAKMKTAHYVKAEKLIHNMIDLLATNKRVRKSREFFNIEPWAALEIFEDVADVLDDAEVIQVAKKNDAAASSSESVSHGITETGTMLVGFWREFKKHASEKSPHLMRFLTQKEQPQNFYDIHVGLNCCHIFLGVSVMHKRIKIGVWAHHNNALQDKFVSKKDILAKNVGGEFEIRGNKALSMCTYKDFDMSEKDKWDEAFDWYIEKFPLLRDAMQKIVSKED